MMMDQDAFDFLNSTFFGNKQDIQTKNKKSYEQVETEYLDELWLEYNDEIQSLKDDGYKILRTDCGKHKVIKGGD